MRPLICLAVASILGGFLHAACAGRVHAQDQPDTPAGRSGSAGSTRVYGSTAVGVGAAALFVIQPGEPGDDVGAGGEVSLILDVRPEGTVPYSMRLEAVVSGLSDAGVGTVGLASRLYLLAFDFGRHVDWRLGGHLGLRYRAASYSTAGAAVAGDAGDFVAGGDTELALTTWPGWPQPSPSRESVGNLEIAVHGSVQLLLGTNVVAGVIGIRAAYLLL